MPELTEGHGHQHCYVTNNDNMFVNSAKLDLYHRTTPEAAEQIRVPENVAELDDEFPSGEQHYRVHPRHIKPEHFVEEK
jgi:hypothetical protein